MQSLNEYWDILEAFQRNAMSAVADTHSEFRYRDDVARLGELTDDVEGFPYESTGEALNQMYIPLGAGIGHVYQKEWTYRGGARFFIHGWFLGLHDLLCRLDRIFSHTGVLVRGGRIQMQATGFEDLRAHCSALNDLIKSINAKPGTNVCTADFWRSFKSVCEDRKPYWYFWFMWWSCAAGQIELTKGIVDAKVVKHAVMLLEDAARELYAETSTECLKRLLDYLEDDKDGNLASSEPYAYAVDCLGLRAYCANSCTPNAEAWSAS